MNAIFCDGLKDVTILNGVVRLEFHRVEAVQRENGHTPRTVSEVIVALPLPGLADALGKLEKLRDELIKQGVLKRNAGSADASHGPRSEPRESPNFS